jgi:hypothetical protein
MEALPNIISKEELIELSKAQNWADLWVILLTHTIKRLRYRYGIHEKKEQLKVRAKTHLSEVLDLVFIKGTRNWNSDHYPTFQDFLISVIDSQLSNSFSKSSSKEESVEEIADNRLSENAGDEISYKELKEKTFKILEENGANDDELLVFECMADGIVKPQHIRAELGIDENAFRNIWRRLGPKLELVRKNLESDE